MTSAHVIASWGMPQEFKPKMTIIKLLATRAGAWSAPSVFTALFRCHKFHGSVNYGHAVILHVKHQLSFRQWPQWPHLGHWRIFGPSLGFWEYVCQYSVFTFDLLFTFLTTEVLTNYSDEIIWMLRLLCEICSRMKNGNKVKKSEWFIFCLISVILSS